MLETVVLLFITNNTFFFRILTYSHTHTHTHTVYIYTHTIYLYKLLC